MKLIIIIGLVALFLVGTSFAYKGINTNAKIYVIDHNRPIVYEITHPIQSDHVWFKINQHKIMKRNSEIHKLYEKVSEKKRIEKKTSRRKSIKTRTKSYHGLDVPKYWRGDFAKKVDPIRHPLRSKFSIGHGYYIIKAPNYDFKVN